MKKNIIVVGLLMMACATTKTNQLTTSYNDWDTNKDGALQRNEFIEGYKDSDYFERWSNSSSSLSYNNFLNDAFNFIDRNRSTRIEKAEFDGQINSYYFETRSNRFDQWDKNSNGLIDIGEFIERAKISQLASLWDSNSDKSISEQEMANGMFDLCNSNNDLKVDQQEFDAWRAKRNVDVSSAHVLHQ